TPPHGADLASAVLSNVAVTADTSLTITLPTPVTLSVRVLDAFGNEVPAGVTVGLPDPLPPVSGGSGTVLRVPPGTGYSLSIAGSFGDPAFPPPGGLYNVPNTWSIGTTIDLTQNTTLTVQPPFKQVHLHVQDPAGTAVNGATVTAN